MNKKIIIGTIVMLVYLICVSGFMFFKNTSNTMPHKEILKSLVYVRGLSHSASGVVIKSDEHGSLILTNKHVCEPHKLGKDITEALAGVPTYLQLFTYAKTIAIAQPVKVAINSDLCLLHTTQTNLYPAKIASKPAKAGDLAYTCGNPWRIRNLCYSGKISDYNYALFMLYRFTSVPARPGQSGSGIFNEDAELIGLVSLGMTDGSFSAMVPLAHIKLFLAGIEL